MQKKAAAYFYFLQTSTYELIGGIVNLVLILRIVELPAVYSSAIRSQSPSGSRISSSVAEGLIITAARLHPAF